MTLLNFTFELGLYTFIIEYLDPLIIPSPEIDISIELLKLYNKVKSMFIESVLKSFG
jgi:hypothetical protein